MKTLSFALATLFLAQGAIAATQQPIRATLATPLAAPQRVDAGPSSWTCTGAVCIGPASNARLGDPRACRELVKAAGAVVSFTGVKGELAAGDLAKCNEKAKKVA